MCYDMCFQYLHRGHADLASVKDEGDRRHANSTRVCAECVVNDEAGEVGEVAGELEVKIRTAFGSTGGDIAGARLAGPATIFI